MHVEEIKLIFQAFAELLQEFDIYHDFGDIVYIPQVVRNAIT